MSEQSALPDPIRDYVDEHRLKVYRITLPPPPDTAVLNEINKDPRRERSRVVVATSEREAWSRFCDGYGIHPSRRNSGAMIERLPD